MNVSEEGSMTYKVKKRSGQKGWSLRLYEKGIERYVEQKHWPEGVRVDWTLEEARAYIRTLNSSNKLSGEEVRRLRALERHTTRMKIIHDLLPQDVVLQFERNNILFLNEEDPTRKKREYVWYDAQTLIANLGIHPSDWYVSPDSIYQYMTNKKWSWDYCKRVASAMSKYGMIYCRKYNKPFFPLQLNDQKKRVQIEIAFGDGEESEPFEISQLAELQKHLKVESFNWLWIAFWFGLRPYEVDMLHSISSQGMSSWWIEDDGTTIVVYQPKLTKVKPKKRYKRIPLLYSEQFNALEIIHAGRFKRPTRSEQRRYFPNGVSLYGCRHGFACLMDKFNTNVQIISRWLGHQSITTTERYYLRLGLKKVA